MDDPSKPDDRPTAAAKYTSRRPVPLALDASVEETLTEGLARMKFGLDARDEISLREAQELLRRIESEPMARYFGAVILIALEDGSPRDALRQLLSAAQEIFSRYMGPRESLLRSIRENLQALGGADGLFAVEHPVHPSDGTDEEIDFRLFAAIVDGLDPEQLEKLYDSISVHLQTG
jgi:hypothetical protein